MSKVFPKNKEKRSRTSSNETHTSFVKNVTSRVSGLLPSTITKWFSNSSSSNANGSAATAEATDSSTEDEAPESPVVTPPPAKRMRYNTSMKYNHFGERLGLCSTSNIEVTEIPVSPYLSNTRNSLNLSPIRSANETITNESHKDKSGRESKIYKRQHSMASTGPTVATKRKSIFDKSSEDTNKSTAKSPPSAEKEPCCKPSTLGSPFYPGPTMYGGAASSYINQPNIQQHTVALVNETKSSEDSVMSSSARRIMDLLEAYSSPLKEARRIPQYTRPTANSFNTSTERFAPYSGKKSFSYKTQELYVPRIANIMRITQKNRLMDTTRTARQLIASHSSATNYPMTPPATISTIDTSPSSQSSQDQPQIIEARQDIQNEESNKMTTKVKTRVTRMNRGISDKLDIATPVKLPSTTLQIDPNKLPNFSFDSSNVPKLPPPSIPKLDSKQNEIKKELDVSTSKHETVTSNQVFKFCNPVAISSDIPNADIMSPRFVFDSPDTQIDQKFDRKSDDSSVVGNVNEIKIKPKDWQCPECWVNNKADVAKCVCCGYKAVKPTKCSTCKIADSQPQKDKCVLCDKVASPPSTKPKESSKWKCDSCWVMNEDSVAKCVCCGGNKPSEASKAATTALAAEIAAATKVKQPSCAGGFVIGNRSTEPIVPIKTLKLPISLASVVGGSDKTDSESIPKTQKPENWECSICLVKNMSNKSLCACCGADKELEKGIKFNFGDKPHSFKFGIDPKEQEAKLSKASAPTSSQELKLKEQSETNNNVLNETPSYTFALPVKKADTKSDDQNNKSEVAVKFSFGIPKDASVPPKTTVPSKELNEEKEKLQEVPQVNFTTPIQESTKPLFSSPLPQQVEKDKSSNVTSNLFSQPSTEAPKDSNSINLQPAVTTVEKSLTQNTFSLGTPSIKIATNLFAPPASISVSTNLFTPPAQHIVVTTSASTLPSLIPPVTSSQKTETPNSTASGPTPLMFSFGNNASSPVQTSASAIASGTGSGDKPKFQFTFGSNSNKTDAPPSLLPATNLFKSPFGTSNDNTGTVTNNFRLTSGNTLGSNSALATSTNGLSATNGLSGNGLSTSTLGGNTISGNPLGGNLMGGNTLTGNTFASNSITGGNGVTSTGALGGTNGLPGKPAGTGLQANVSLTNNPLANNSTSNIFGNAVQKENMWNTSSTSPSNNLFVTNSNTNNLQKTPSFTFAASSPFNAATPPPAFGSNTQPAQNIFGMANQNNNPQPSLFSSPVQNQAPSNLFGSPQTPANPPAQMGMFGTSNVNSSYTFGSQASATPPQAPLAAPVPSFSFGSSQPAVFGFGQQQPQQQPQQAGVYSFGGPPAGGTPQVQFNMGTAPNPAGRRLRKAVRRTTPR